MRIIDIFSYIILCIKTQIKILLRFLFYNYLTLGAHWTWDDN